jgi:hypothetical protein
MQTAIELLRQGRKDEIWKRYCGYLDWDIGQFMAVQRKLLEEQLGKYSSCGLWSHIMKRGKPKNADEFRKIVPLTTYGVYAPFLLQKDAAALPEMSYCWAHTSGRSGEYETKWIPYSRSLYEQVGDAFLAAFILAGAKGKGDIVLREGMTFPYVLAPPPYISGLIMESMLERFPFKVLPSLERAAGMDFQERIKAAFEEAMSEGLDFFWGITSILMKMGESFEQQSGSGGDMAKLFKKPKALARIAKAALSAALQGRHLKPKDIWKVKGAICGGMDTTMLKGKVAELWGIEPMEGYGCTEFGAIAFQTWSREYLTFYPYMNFWEFVTEKDYQKCMQDPDFIPEALHLDEVQAGGEYVLVGTNFHGGSILRYILGDFIKIEALEDAKSGIRLPQMSFVSRIDGLIDIGGFTRLTEKVIWQAIENSGIAYEEWSVRKESLGERPILKLYIELKSEGLSAEAIAEKVHACLRQLDAPYRDMEEIASIRPLVVSVLSKGTFKRYMQERQAAGADLAHTKPPHVNSSDKVIASLGRMSDWKL